MIKKERILENFLEMVRIPSPSKNERELADYLKNKLLKLGLEVKEDNTGEKIGGNTGNIIGVLKGKKKGNYLFSAHMDTVKPCEKINPILENGIIKTDGTSILGGDDKGGIAAILEMIETLIESDIDYPTITVVFSVAEEIGLLGAKNLNISELNIDCAFVLDSSGKPGKIITKAPASARGEIEILGRAAHAGLAPENGLNALVVTADIIKQLKLGRIDFETTANIGVISGGDAVNIVMPKLKMSYEARSLSLEKLNNLLKETQNTINAICSNYKTDYIWNVEIKYPGFSIEDNSDILNKISNALGRKKIKAEFVASGGGSDANIYNFNGIEAVNMAVGMTKVHTVDEFIELKDIELMAEILIEIIKE